MFAVYLLGITVAFSISALIYVNLPTSTLVVSKTFKHYDYVIVGAGSAGCVLANRLSEDGGSQVLLLEAGHEETKYSLLNIPLTAFQHQQTELDWSYVSEPQINASLSFNDQQISYPQGKALGGSSNLNFMLYVRGSPHDYNGWAADGAEGWSYEEVLPYFLKSEDNHNAIYSKTDFHRKGGLLTVTDMAYTPLAEAFVQAGIELGYKRTDINSDHQIGVSHSQATIKQGNRWSSVKAFLRPAMKRLNLHVATAAHVQKILFKNRRAVGVEFYRNGTTHAVYARKEVIVSAGAIGSPHLLLLSGIGPKEHLNQMGIPVIADLPVGQNLQDHAFVPLQWHISSPVAIYEKKAKSLWSLFDHLLFGQGILSTSGVEGTAFFRSEHQPPNESYPYLQMHMLVMLTGSGMSVDSIRRMQHKVRLPGKVFNALFGKNKDKEGFQLFSILLHSKSRGYVELRSLDPREHPVIDPMFLQDPTDVKVLLEGIRLSQKFGASHSFRMYGARPVKEVHPHCTQMPYDSDDYWICYIHQMASSLYHPSGTCKMGRMGDPSAVVDPQLRVQGVEHLRVVDSSIMPTITSGNINAPTIMIAEKASDIIRGIVSVDSKGRPLENSAEQSDLHDPHDEL